ncbi:hypothetical protein [Mucilaginibacter humi]|uniref:hypothetical protein n=1 Tax=Mucilaginibacter humi TaxID=2732510 RepID=UPI001FE95127|nr:hypothetical protein [Mucilaginibacter humi]
MAKAVTKTNSPLTDRWSDGWGQNWQGKDPNDRTSFDRFLEDEDWVKPRAYNLYRGAILI